MEIGLQKRRSSWCDEEDLVWHPWRRWGGRWSWSFLQIADFLPGLSIAIIVVISKMLTMMMTMLMMISALISLLMAMVQVCIAMIYIYWSGLAEPLYPYIYFQQVTLLLSSDAIGILFSCLFASTFALLMAMIQVCSAFGDLQCSVRAILGFDVKGSQFTDAVINISTSAQVCFLFSLCLSSCEWQLYLTLSD